MRAIWDNTRACLVEDQVEAGAQPVPLLLERHDARTAAADFQHDGGARKCFLQLLDPRSHQAMGRRSVQLTSSDNRFVQFLTHLEMDLKPMTLKAVRLAVTGWQRWEIRCVFPGGPIFS